MNKTPVNVAMGSRLMAGLRTSVKSSMNTPDMVELTRWRAPFMMLMVDWPIMASPPMAGRRVEQATMMRTPCEGRPTDPVAPAKLTAEEAADQVGEALGEALLV